LSTQAGKEDEESSKRVLKLVKKDLDEKIHKIEGRVLEIQDHVEGSVLEKVGEMLTNNIYDIIPGYAELEEKVE
jgi:hypothetical protein